MAAKLGANAEFPQYLVKLHLQIKGYFSRGTYVIAGDPLATEQQKITDTDLLYRICLKWSTTVCRLCGDLGH